jgi:Family of unknown function (DUF6504)
MSRVYGEPVEVQTRADGRPAGFAWRKRRYTVISVQEYWMVNRDWWRESAPFPARPELEFWRVEASAADGGYLPAGRPPERPGNPAGEPARRTRPYRAGQSAGTYELRRDIAAGTWTLHRVAD